ncbi:MAG: hypothetical protein NTX16_12320 [Actinobacteria bacterium]|nr:hypothetical protein [Actinomycetota bacterium]
MAPAPPPFTTPSLLPASRRGGRDAPPRRFGAVELALLLAALVCAAVGVFLLVAG